MSVTDAGERAFEFGSLSIVADGRVLEPRAWTAMQSRWAAELSDVVPPGPILELCAGAGQIGLFASVLCGRPLVQVEQSAHAAEFARRNAAAAGLSDRVEVRCAPMESALAGDERFPLILADPPYLRRAEVDAFPDDPVEAIDGGDDGLDGIRACLGVVRAHLLDGGACLLQVRGPRQADEVGALARVDDVRVVDDDRAVVLVSAV